MGGGWARTPVAHQTLHFPTDRHPGGAGFSADVIAVFFQRLKGKRKNKQRQTARISRSGVANAAVSVASLARRGIYVPRSDVTQRYNAVERRAFWAVLIVKRRRGPGPKIDQNASPESLKVSPRWTGCSSTRVWIFIKFAIFAGTAKSNLIFSHFMLTCKSKGFIWYRLNWSARLTFFTCFCVCCMFFITVTQTTLIFDKDSTFVP